MDSAAAQKVITDQLKMVLSNQERIMSIISVLQMAIGKIRNQFTINSYGWISPSEKSWWTELSLDMTPAETNPKKQSQDEGRFLPEVNMERAKRSKRSNVNSPKPRATVRESRPSSFEEESRLDTAEEPMVKIVKMETDKEQGYFSMWN